MKRYRVSFGLMVVLCALAASEADAGGWPRVRLFARGHSYPPAKPLHYDAPPHNYHYPHHYPSAEELYPKYYGAFHYRHLDNIGIPNGDIGIRGNGLYMSPW